jgi:hypothetical protein
MDVLFNGRFGGEKQSMGNIIKRMNTAARDQENREAGMIRGFR